MIKENKKIITGKKTVHILIKTAKVLFAQNGYTNTHMEQVANLARVSRGALYHHFKFKKKLFEAVLEEILADIYVQMTKSIRACNNPWDKLLIGSRTFLKAATHPAAEQIFIIDAAGVLGEEKLRKIDENYTVSILKNVLIELEKGLNLSSINVDVLAEAIYGASQQCAIWVVNAKDSKKALIEANATLELLYSSLKKV